MSGHSKWATIKHKKAANDKARGKLFAKLIRQVEVAAREGGGDLETNPTLRTMFQKARDSSIPIDTIERAVKRGTGELEGRHLRADHLRGLRPRRGRGDGRGAHRQPQPHRRRDPQHLHASNGGSMAEPGAVAWQFERKGQVVVPRSVDEEELMLAALDAGADDIVDDGDAWRVTTPPDRAARRAGRARGGRHRRRVVRPDDGAADDHRPLDTAEAAKQVLRLIDALDDHDDVGACTPTSTSPTPSSRPWRLT